MGLLSWARRVFRSDPEKLAMAELNREERLAARLEAEEAKAQAEAVRQQFGPPVPPGVGGF